MHIAICDDTASDREFVAEILKEYASQNSIHLDLTVYDSGANLLYDVEDGCRPNIIFLDIYVGTLFGINIARRLREFGFEGEIVFLTATAEFAVASYEVNASGYLIKPPGKKKIFSLMDKICSNYITQTYTIRSRSNIIHIPLQEILYIESRNNKCVLHRKNGGECTVYKKLNEIEAELSAPHFLRCHQSYLVNMDYIKSADKEFEMVSGDIIAIRQRDLKTIHNAYLDYLSKQGKKYAK